MLLTPNKGVALLSSTAEASEACTSRKTYNLYKGGEMGVVLVTYNLYKGVVKHLEGEDLTSSRIVGIPFSAFDLRDP